MAMWHSEQFEQVLNDASKIDDRINDNWMDMIGDPDYSTLIDFFSHDNYFDSVAEEDYDEQTVVKLLKRVIAGKDRIKLIQLAFDLGRLVGQAEYSLLNGDY